MSLALSPFALAQYSGGGMMGGYGSYGSAMGGGYNSPLTLEQLNEQKNQTETVLSQFEQIRQQLNNPQSHTSLDCVDKKTCSFRDVCLDLQKNRNAKVLYRNSQGEELTNYRRLQMEQQILTCVNNNRQILLAIETQRAQLLSNLEVQKQWDQTLLKSQRTAFHQQKELSETILKNQDSEKYLKVQLALQEITLEVSEQNTGAWPSPKEWIEKAQQRAQVQLSPGTIEAFLKFNASTNNYSGYAMDPNQKNSSPPTIQIATTENPFFDAELTTNAVYAGGTDKMYDYQKQVAQKIPRAKKIFEQTRQFAIQALESYKNEANKFRIENMITRLKTVSFEIAPATANSCAIPNAFYSPGRHGISVCPSNLNTTEGDLLSLMGHELGHAVDPCNLALDLRQDANNNYFVIQSESKTKKVAASTLVATGIHYDQNPLGGILTCLQDEDHSLGVKVGSPQDRANYIKEIAKSVDGSGGDRPDLPDDRSLMLQQKKYRACNYSEDTHRSQMQEGFSDWLRGEVSKLRLQQESDPARRKELAYEVISGSGDTGCFGLVPELPESSIVMLEKLGCHNYQNNNVNGLAPDREHSPTYKRVNNILLALPEVANPLGCETTPNMVHCE